MRIRVLTVVIGTCTLGTLLVSAHARVGRPAWAFQKYFRALQYSEASVNPVERVLFSLILANANPESAKGL